MKHQKPSPGGKVAERSEVGRGMRAGIHSIAKCKDLLKAWMREIHWWKPKRLNKS